jgi:hypothetical protein
MIPAWQVCDIEFQCPLAQFVRSERLKLRLASGKSKWELNSKYDEFRGKPGAPSAKEEYLMFSLRWARGVLMVMAKCRMKWRGKNPGHGAPTGIEERLSSVTAHPC